MRKFWAVYGILPIVLLSIFFSFVVATPSAAAPGVLVEHAVRFKAADNTLDPNVALTRVNQERVAHHVTALQAHEQLGRLAQARADDMAQRSYYAHRNPDGRYYFDYFDDYRIKTGYNCENLDLVFAPNLEQVINEWNASVKGHKECMMNSNTTLAGYGSAKLALINYDGTATTAYVIVAIHAQKPLP